MNYNWNNYTALVAEDDPMNFKYIELLLSRRTGISIVWAKDGNEAIRISQEVKSIDIILLDLQLPEKDGLTVLRTIRKTDPYIPVIIQTANSWNNEEEECFNAGANGFFNKPLNIDEMLTFIENIIRKSPRSKASRIHL